MTAGGAAAGSAARAACRGAIAGSLAAGVREERKRPLPLRSASASGSAGSAGIRCLSRRSRIDQRDLSTDADVFDGSATLVLRLNLHLARFEVTAVADVHDALALFQEQRLSRHVKHVLPRIAGDGNVRRQPWPHARV